MVVDPVEPGQQKTVAAWRARLAQVDSAFKSQLKQPVRQRDYLGLREQFAALAAQDVDMYTRLYAARRMEQIDALADAASASARIESLGDQVTTVRREYMLERSRLQQPVAPIERGFDAKGELRQSLIYSSPVGPHRYRLIDPSLKTPRTLCYVEIRPDSGIDVDRYLGQVVGVYAGEKYLQTGDVNPIAVLVAEKLVVLDSGTAATTSADRNAAPSASDSGVRSSPVPVRPSANPVPDGEMIEMVPVEEFTPVASTQAPRQG